jgi:4-hydroxybenzoate polyprenyltransferase
MNFEGIPNRSSEVKKWERILFLPILPLLVISIALGWNVLLLVLFGFAILTQGFIYNFYRKEGRGKEFLVRMSIPLLAALVILAFFGFEYFFKN